MWPRSRRVPADRVQAAATATDDGRVQHLMDRVAALVREKLDLQAQLDFMLAENVTLRRALPEVDRAIRALQAARNGGGA